MNDNIAPHYLMNLISNIEQAIWTKFSSYRNAKFYIKKWHKVEYDEWNSKLENFTIELAADDKIDLPATLHNIDGETLIRIAIDLGLETPGFIPSIPLFRNEIKSEYSTASLTFEKAFKEIEEHPDVAIGLANSALESIIKEILKDERIETKLNSKKTLYDLTVSLLKEFQIHPTADMPVEIKTIGSSFLAINKCIEDLRSKKPIYMEKQ